jgi:hypothetical protein
MIIGETEREICLPMSYMTFHCYALMLKNSVVARVRRSGEK